MWVAEVPNYLSLWDGKLGVALQVGSGEGDVYAVLSLSCEVRETVFQF